MNYLSHAKTEFRAAGWLDENGNYTDDMQQEMVDTVMTKNADQAFAQTVLIHHKGAIAFSQVVAKYGNDDKVRSLTNTLIDTQQAEIQLLQNWLRNHGYTQ